MPKRLWGPTQALQKLGMVAYTYNPHTLNEGGSEVQDYSQLHSEFKASPGIHDIQEQEEGETEGKAGRGEMAEGEGGGKGDRGDV